MREVHFQLRELPPYSLHDCRVSRILAKDDAVELFFENRISRVGGGSVPGRVRITGVDFDCASVEILQSASAPYGTFKGESVELYAFAKRFYGQRFEIIDEYYGFRKLLLSGWLWVPGRNPRETRLSIGYFTGDIVYVTGEPEEKT